MKQTSNCTKKLASYIVCCTTVLLTACASQPQQTTPPPQEDNLTVGTAQREIRLGMSSTAVVEALGSPNLVSTDTERREVWVYDKIFTEVNRQSASGGVWLLGIGGSGAGGAGVGGSRDHAQTQQRTLTVIVKFDEAERVRDFAYHTSRF
jgi:outer membrane protein assembly factor BamE (lipoprotein component of BamABCDE complex)